MTSAPGVNVIEIENMHMQFYCHYKVILSFCAVKLYYLGNYNGMAVNKNGKKVFKIFLWWQTYILQ
jgi:hypothetical protein